MADADMSVVTGAFGFTGRYITRELLSRGRRVKTLTGHPDRVNPFGERIAVGPLCFDRTRDLINAMRGASTLINTYWVRFNRGAATYDRAVTNTRALIRAAQEAGVKKFVHISITNPSLDSRLPYFRGKAVVERNLTESGLRYAIIRPSVVFGIEDILINNIAWFLRRLPIFAIPGDGEYRVQPIFVGDVAKLAAAAADREDDTTIDAVGPDVFTFNDLVRTIARSVGSRSKILHAPSVVAWMGTCVAGFALGDVVLTRDEIAGLTANLLVSDGPPTGPTSFAEFLEQNSDKLGRKYASELVRHYR